MYIYLIPETRTPHESGHFILNLRVQWNIDLTKNTLNKGYQKGYFPGPIYSLS